ncbi:12395_t:CDS:2, partial [Dentiscutata erythropus]
DNGADRDGADGNEANENSVDEDEVVKCSGNNAYWSSFLSALDKQEESIHIKLTTLLAEISQDNIGSREEMYKF